MWSLAGAALAFAVAAVAWRRSSARGGYYDTDVYGMTPAMHRRYAFVSLAFAVFFAIAFATKNPAAGLIALAVDALVADCYAASFLRGAESDE